MRVRFNDLPQPCRARFLELANSKVPGDPRVLLRSNDFPSRWLRYVGVVGALIAIAVILEYTITRGQVVDPIHDKETYYAFAGAIGILLVSISGIVTSFTWKPPPYTEGSFVFPSYMVRTVGGELDVMSLGEIGVPNVVTVRRNGGYVHTRLELGGGFTFTFNSDGAAQSSWTRIAEARARWRTLLAARDANGIAQIDPFVDCTVAGTWSFPHQPPAPPLAAVTPKGVTLGRWGGSFVVGMVTAFLYFTAVDFVFSDSRADHNRPTTPAPAKRPRR